MRSVNRQHVQMTKEHASVKKQTFMKNSYLLCNLLKCLYALRVWGHPWISLLVVTRDNIESIIWPEQALYITLNSKCVCIIQSFEILWSLTSLFSRDFSFVRQVVSICKIWFKIKFGILRNTQCNGRFKWISK